MLTACSQQSGDAADTSKVLARVNGEPITEFQLMTNVETLFGNENAGRELKDTDRKKILQSMVMSRLFRQQAELKMNEETKLKFKQKAEQYKEKIIVNKYLKNNISSAMVSNEMVLEYYNKHLEKYASEEVVRYELLTINRKMTEAERDKLLAIYSVVKKTDELIELQKEIAKNGVALQYSQGVLGAGLLDLKVEKILKNLKQGEVSTLSMQKGRPYILKLVEKSQKPARSLSEVGAEIRRQLAPVAMKKAIQEQAEKLKASATIEYL